jgi:hypothetical protein
MTHHNTTLSGIGGYLAEACPTAGRVRLVKVSDRGATLLVEPR